MGRRVVFVALVGLVAAAGCAPTFKQLRVQGQTAWREGNYAVARDRFEGAFALCPEHGENLLDMGSLRMVRARDLLEQGSHAAAMREADCAVAYFDRAVEANPGLQAAWEARNDALEFKGRYADALHGAEWAMTFTGPSARAHLFVAQELEERGDIDGALLRYRQAVAIEPNSAKAHAALGQFLVRIGWTKDAIEHLEAAYRLNPLEPGVAQALTDSGVPLPRTTPQIEP